MPDNSTKPGFKTTEFWIAIPAAAVGLGLIAFGAVNGNPEAVDSGTMLFGMAAGAYGIGRGIAKLGGS